jgi:hypothetical protein
MSEQDTMRLVAELLDKTSGPLKDIQKTMRETAAVAKKLHDAGVDGAKEHEKSQSKLHASIERTRRELTGSLTPAMAALGLSTFGVAEGIGKVIDKLKEMGDRYNVMNDIAKRAGMSVDQVRILSTMFVRLGVDADKATQSAADFGEHMDKLARGTNAEENIAWATKLGGAYKALGDTLRHTPTRAGQLDAVFNFFSSHPNIPIDQKRKFYEELLHLPPELATKSAEQINEALGKAMKEVAESQWDDEKAKRLNTAFQDLRASIRGIDDDLVGAFGGRGAEMIERLSKAIHQDVEDIKAFSELMDKISKTLGLNKDVPLGQETNPFADILRGLGEKKPKESREDRIKRQHDLWHPSAFIEGGGSDQLSEGVKTGMLAAFREWFAATSSKGGGYSNANYESGGNTGGAAKALGAFHDGGGFKVLDGNDNTGTNGGQGAMGEGNAGGGINRDKWLAQLNANPALKEELFRRAIGENDNPLANQAVMEEAANRADIRGNKGFADHGNLSYFQGHRGFNKTERAMMEKNFDKVFRQDGAIDNSSQWLSAKHERNGRFRTTANFGGDGITGHRGVESFEAPGWGESGRGERDRYPSFRANQLAEAQRRREAQMHTVKGDASLGITLNGFPKGTRTDLTYGGLFTSYSLSRGRQMEASEQK